MARTSQMIRWLLWSYLTRWAELNFSRNRFTVVRDQTRSLYFLNSDVQRAVIDQERKDNSGNKAIHKIRVDVR